MSPTDRIQSALREYARESVARAVPPGLTAQEIATQTGVPLSRVRQELRWLAQRGSAEAAWTQTRTGARYWRPGPRDLVAQGRGLPEITDD